MVKVAIAGANSGLALEVIDKLVEDQKHEVVALCRKDPAQFPQQRGVNWVQTSFKDKTQLVNLFSDVEVVLNFIVVSNDPGSVVSKLLVDAAVEAGVKRFAPSEWAMGQKVYDIIDAVPWYQGKLDMQAYLRKINEDKKVIEYCFFQPGLFMEYTAFPRQLTRHVPPMAIAWQLDDLRIVAIEGHEDDPMTVTTVSDIAGVVRRAVEYEGEWPEIGGITGESISPRQLQHVVEKIRGKLVRLEIVKESDVDTGILRVDMPPIQHPSIPEDQREAWHTPGWIGILTAVAKGAWAVTDEWNKLLPDYKFTGIEEFVKQTWGGKSDL
ncbi:2-hydroxyisoflavone reductase [Pleurostoma richardsiae]|uniref:2-hydroxyisoflavone reductase n=1 Tax=Pleurostoma richardsiae TaxID=41990 RepID=A0AA38VJ63_9PEZI|nr:2-hydroxyisoflavone reductase [Pleurostoma richardsiae]